MKVSSALPAPLLAQTAFFALVLVSAGLPRMVYFALFWVAALGTLLLLLLKASWSATEWVVFGAFSASVLAAVLLSGGALTDPVAVVIPILGLLLVSAIISAIPRPSRSRKRRAVPAQRLLPDAFYSVPGSDRFHRRECRMLRGRQDLRAFLTEDEARAAGKRPCGFCYVRK